MLEALIATADAAPAEPGPGLGRARAAWRPGVGSGASADSPARPVSPARRVLGCSRAMLIHQPGGSGIQDAGELLERSRSPTGPGQHHQRRQYSLSTRRSRTLLSPALPEWFLARPRHVRATGRIHCPAENHLPAHPLLTECLPQPLLVRGRT